MAAALAACSAYAAADPAADLILHNGTIHTLAPARPKAQALAVRGDLILAVGSDAAILKLRGPKTEVINLRGATAIPGFIEGHGHFMGVGQFKRSLNLRDTTSWQQIVGMVGAVAKEAKPGEWIIGRGFHQSKWTAPPSPAVQGFPVHDELSAVSPANPVLLTHASGHAGMANAKAMELAGVTRGTKDPPGGEILRDRAGNATGLMNERAQGLIRKAYAEYLAHRTEAQTEEDATIEARLAAQEALRHGITSFQDAGSSFATVDLLRKLNRDGGLGLRLWIMLRESNETLAARGAGYRSVDKWVTVRAIKRTMDGALESRGAWMLEPYADLPDRRGLNTAPVAEVAATGAWALANGFQLCVHAIGDRGNRETLDVFERAAGGRRDLRWRVEHAQHLNAADIPRFGKLGVIAAMQGIHCTSDAPYVLARLGAAHAEEGAYVWRKLLASGAVVGNGTDAPVEDIDPIASFHATVTRQLKDGSVFYPAQRLTRLEALRSYTTANAYAAFEESSKGMLQAGKLADITVLSRDILAVPDSEIAGAEVLYTITGGQVKYRR